MWFWKFLKISPTCPKFNTHKKFVVHFFIPMLLLPLTPPLIYLKLKKIKGPKMDSLSLFTFTFHNHGGRRSIAEVRSVRLFKVNCEWKKWVSEVKWCFFGPLNFFIFRYVEEGVLGNNYISIKKCTTSFLWVLNLGQVGGRRKNFRNHSTTVTFWKMVSKVIFWKNCKGISL